MAATLSSLTSRSVARAGHRALMRLMLRMYAETHRLLWQTYGYVKMQIEQSADSEGYVSGVALSGRLPAIELRFRADIQRWAKLLERAREQAASILFGGHVVHHNHYFRSLTDAAGTGRAAGSENRLQESMTADQVETLTRLWAQRRQRALAAAATRVMGDGLQLSHRIWRLEMDGLARIRNTLMTAFAGMSRH